MQFRYRMLVYKMARLAEKGELTAVQEIGFATQLAELVDKENLAGRVIEELFEHDYPQIRRIALNAIRRTGEFDLPELKPALLRRMSDSEPWLRHDAVWIIQEAEMDGGMLRAALRRLAGDVQLPQDAVKAKSNPGDAMLHARVRARQVLDGMLKKDATAALAALRAAMATLQAVTPGAYGQGTVGKLNEVRRDIQRRVAGRALASSTKLTFRRVEGDAGNVGGGLSVSESGPTETAIMPDGTKRKADVD